MNRKTVLFLFGGESSEHDVSLMSAKNVHAALDTARVQAVLCYIDTQGRWWHVTKVEKPVQPPEIQVTPLLGMSAVRVGNEELPIDVVFPVLHGRNGEDGSVQGLAALMHTPIVGCGLDASLLCMDKTLTKQLLQTAGISVVPGVTHSAAEIPDFDLLTKQLGDILFMKPVRQGSSVGVGKASETSAYEAVFREAARYDDAVLIETAVEGARELEVAVLGDTHNPKVSVVGEIVPDREFYSYESKYNSASTSQVVIPAAISAEMKARIQKDAAKAYAVLRCRGLARIDFFLASDGQLYLNEVNTMPGFTNISMYPKLWEASGLSYKELIAILIDKAA